MCGKVSGRYFADDGLRRLDSLLEPTKQAVMDLKAMLDDKHIDHSVQPDPRRRLSQGPWRRGVGCGSECSRGPMKRAALGVRG